MKNIDFTDFFNVFLSGATIRRRLFFFRAHYITSYLSGKTIEYMLCNHLPLRRVRILAEHFYRMETKFPIR